MFYTDVLLCTQNKLLKSFSVLHLSGNEKTSNVKSKWLNIFSCEKKYISCFLKQENLPKQSYFSKWYKRCFCQVFSKWGTTIERVHHCTVHAIMCDLLFAL